MNEAQRKALIDTSWQMHDTVEKSYMENAAVKGSDDWLEKQRILLADMALHLLQTALKPNDIDHDKLKNNLHSILTISDQFLPEAELKKATDKLFQ